MRGPPRAETPDSLVNQQTPSTSARCSALCSRPELGGLRNKLHRCTINQ
jgi:hypothetical protein